MTMSNQETLSALADLSQRIYDKATEARGMREAMKQHGRHHEAKLHDTRITALVELGNEVDRIITQAQKTSVDQPSPAVPCIAGLGELGAAPSLHSGAGGWWDEVKCPHCGYECEDSKDMGCPDVDWTEETECAMCEKTFEWSRLTTTQYLARPVAGEGESGNDSEPGHSPNDPSSATRGGDR